MLRIIVIAIGSENDFELWVRSVLPVAVHLGKALTKAVPDGKANTGTRLWRLLRGGITQHHTAWEVDKFRGLYH